MMKNDLGTSLKETFDKKNREISSLSNDLVAAKTALWEAQARKKLLLSKAGNKTEWNPEVAFSELKAKFELCKGSCVEKVLGNLIKAYQQYQKTSRVLSIVNDEKQELLDVYKDVTSGLNQEASLKSKLLYIQNFICAKEKSTEELKSRLEGLRTGFNDLKISLDNSQIRQLLEDHVQLSHKVQKTVDDQGILKYEIQKIEQLIETEKNVGGVTADHAVKVLKQEVKDCENLIAETVQKIRAREKVKSKVKVQVSKMGSVLGSVNVSIITKTGKDSPRNKYNKSSMSGSSLKKTGKDLGESEKPKPDENKTKPFSYASKVVQSNREAFFNKLK